MFELVRTNANSVSPSWMPAGVVEFSDAALFAYDAVVPATQVMATAAVDQADAAVKV